MWRSDLSTVEQHLLWLGYARPFGGPIGHISRYGAGYEMYNHGVLGVCGQLGLECFDVAPQATKTPSALGLAVRLHVIGTI
jgi:hypothetical protein